MTLPPSLISQLAAVDFAIEQNPYTGAWFCGLKRYGLGGGLGGGDAGPFETPEAALVGGVKWLIGLYRDTDAERDDYAQALRACQAELRAERVSKGDQ